MDRFRVGLEEILMHGQDEREVVPAGIHDIPATPVVDVVRKRAQGVENLFGIPPLLVLDPRPFHLPVVDEVVYVYG